MRRVCWQPTGRSVLGRHPVRDEEQSLVKSHLKLSGIVRREQDTLRVRNPIYERSLTNGGCKHTGQCTGSNVFLQRCSA